MAGEPQPQQQTGWRRWGVKAANGALKVSDWAGGHANNVGSKFGAERFWPTSGDYVQELEKCERILRTFCVEGLPTEESTADGKKKRKVYRKIPPKIIQEAKGIVIFSAFRSGFAPFAGAGGGGVVIARMKDGTWSAPSFISPNNFSAGLMIGIDVYNAVLILRSDAAVQGFRTHHFTIGSEIAVAAGPLGYGASAETGVKNRTPIYSYVLSRGFYAGVEMVGQVFLDRFDENERVYHWPGIKAGDILDGKVRRPVESDKLYQALYDAEAGVAQGSSLEWDTDEVKALDLEPGEVLKLPPTPDQLTLFESIGIPDEEDVRLEEEERKAVRALPPPPKHPHVRNYKFRTPSGKTTRSLPPSPNFAASMSSASVDQFRLPTSSGQESQFNSPHTDSGLFTSSYSNGDAEQHQETVIRQPLPRRPVPPPPVLSQATTPNVSPPAVLVSSSSAGGETGLGVEMPPAPAYEERTVDATTSSLSAGMQTVSLGDTRASSTNDEKGKSRAEDGNEEAFTDSPAIAPPLMHQDSASSASSYEEPEAEAIPPAYDESSPVEVKEKDVADSPGGEDVHQTQPQEQGVGHAEHDQPSHQSHQDHDQDQHQHHHQ